VPTDRKKKRLHARAWVMASSSSIMGRRGDRTNREEVLRNHRLQKIKSRKIFIDAGYTLLPLIVQVPTSNWM
jgi:hypothetical protein